MEEKKSIVLFESADQEVKLEVEVGKKTVWLSQAQMAELFGRNVAVISRHVNNAIHEGEVNEGSNLQKMQIASSDRPVCSMILT